LDEVRENVKVLYRLLTDETCAGAAKRYPRLRTTLLDNSVAQPLVRVLIGPHPTLSKCLGQLRRDFPEPEARQQYLRQAFANIDKKINHATSPVEDEISATLLKFEMTDLWERWHKALARAEDGDYSGAITAARTLLEATCRFVLTEKNAPAPVGVHLPAMFKATAQHLQLAADNSTGHELQRMLNGCSTVVESLATLRNKLGDAHPGSVPDRVQAQLVIRLSGSVAAFLIERLGKQKEAALELVINEQRRNARSV
jgi:Abortive infection C-terminus